MRVGEDTYPVLAIEVIRVATGARQQVKEAGGGIEVVRVRLPCYKNRSQWTNMVALE